MIGLVSSTCNESSEFVHLPSWYRPQDYAFDQSIHFEHVIQACVGVMLKGSLFDML